MDRSLENIEYPTVEVITGAELEELKKKLAQLEDGIDSLKKENYDDHRSLACWIAATRNELNDKNKS